MSIPESLPATRNARPIHKPIHNKKRSGKPGKEAEKQRRRLAALENLPPEIARHRILDTAETLEFVKLCPAEWRKLRAAGKAPRPVMLGTRKQGYRIGDLVDWIASRRQPAA